MRPRSDDEDSERREFILNVILLGSIGMLLILDAVDLYYRIKLGSADRGISFFIFSGILAGFCGLYALSRYGNFQPAAYALIALYFLSISYGAYHFGVDLPPVLLSYALLIVIASILVGTRFSFLVTGLIAAFIIPIWYFQTSGQIPAAWYWKGEVRFVQAIEFAIIFAIIALVSWLSNREIERSLRRARRSEMELREERNLLEKKAEKRTRELQEVHVERMSELSRFAEMGRLAGGMIHDLLSPLTALALSAEELAKRGSGSPDMDEHLDAALTSARRVEDLISAIRKRLSQKEVEIEFSLNREIGHAVYLLSYKAKRARVNIVFHAKSEISIFGDPVKFNQLVSNLLSNAIDAYEGVAAHAAPRDVLIDLSRSHDTICLRVADTGIGIPKNLIDKIFDPFFTTKEASKGTGLGLVTAKHVVEKILGGTLTVESEPGEGTTFTIEFAGYYG